MISEDNYRIKVVVFEPSGNLYGSEFCLLDIIRGTRLTGFEWNVLLPKGGGFDAVLSKDGIVMHHLLPPRIHLLPKLCKILSYWQIRKYIRKSNPDLVYVNQAGMLRAVTAICFGLRLPIVCQVQTLEDARLISRRGGKDEKIQAFISNSRFTASHAMLPLEKSCVFYQPAVGGVVGQAAPAPVAGGYWRIGILGRIAHSKGHPVFLEAAKQLLASGRRDLQFVVIGEGISPKASQEYRDQVKAAGLTDFFDFRGYRTDVPGELARIHVLAIPSVAEPLGRVVLDACKAGVPAVVSDSGGLGEFSRDLGVGWRVPAEDPAALVDAVLSILLDYSAAVEHFRCEAEVMFRRLSSKAYFEKIGTVLRHAAERRPSAIKWFGEEE